MALVENVPFFSILLCMVCGMICAILPGKAARALAQTVPGLVCLMNFALTLHFSRGAAPYVYPMGHFPAPWGNELKAGPLEAVCCCAFSLTAFLSLGAGMKKVREHIPAKKQNLYCVTVLMMLSSVCALLYTNDIFTAYVFIEISTLSAGALIFSRQDGRSLAASVRYLVMNLTGSGLCLMGIAMLYGITGQLNIESIRDSLEVHTRTLALPLRGVLALITVGLAIKSGLFPFHEWLPDAYSYSTPASSCMLSSVISKGYLFLLIKFYMRCVGLETVRQSGLSAVLFVFGAVGLLAGSLHAIRQWDLRRMISYSSVAQISYVFLAIGLCSEQAMTAAVFHMLVHSFGKSMLFLSASGLGDVSGGRFDTDSLRGAGRRNIPAGAAFTCGALSLTGVPLLGGFLSKIYLSQAALGADAPMAVAVLLLLALSTFLNTLYFLHAAVGIYRPGDANLPREKCGPRYYVFLAALILCNLWLGTASASLYGVLLQGIPLFS